MLALGRLKEKSFAEQHKDGAAKKYPCDDVEGLLKSLGLGKESIDKLSEHDIKDPEIFYELDDYTICSLLGIETEGKKHKLSAKIKEVKAKHAKALAALASNEDEGEALPSVSHEGAEKHASNRV
jgi:hypothetical protein